MLKSDALKRASDHGCAGGKAGETVKRLLAIGDLHGNYARFSSLWKKIAFDPAEDFLIFLGDYVDRGAGVRQCLAFVMDLEARYDNVLCLRGNHEQMMLDCCRGDMDYRMWGANGGDITDRELSRWDAQEAGAYARVLAFAERCRLCHRMKVGDTTYIFAHAGLDPDLPLSAQTSDELLWIREKFYRYYAGWDIVVVGHTPTPFLKNGCTTPLFLKNNIFMVDTGSYLKDGAISCVDVLTKTYWQSDV